MLSLAAADAGKLGSIERKRPSIPSFLTVEFMIC